MNEAKDIIYKYKCGHSKPMTMKRYRQYQKWGFPFECKACGVKRVGKFDIFFEKK